MAALEAAPPVPLYGSLRLVEVSDGVALTTHWDDGAYHRSARCGPPLAVVAPSVAGLKSPADPVPCSSLEVVADVDEALASDARAARVPFSSALVLPSNRGGRFPFGPLLSRSSRARGPRSGPPSPP